MRIGLIDVDGHNFPNLALMKISAWHKAQGDDVEWYDPFNALIRGEYDKVYMSKVFSFSDDYDNPIYAKEIHRGGSGYAIYLEDGIDKFGKDEKLPDEIEHIYPDYGLYGVTDTAYGYLTRGCPRGCAFCHVAAKEGKKTYKVADLSEFWNGQKNIVLCDPNLIACRESTELLQELIDSKAWVDINQGVDIRIMTEEKARMFKQLKTKNIHFAWDRYEDKDIIIPKLKMFKEITNIDERTLTVYCLTNFNTTLEQDLERIYTLRDMGYSPYIMVYDKEHTTPHQPCRMLQRWVNNRILFKTVNRFEDYRPHGKDLVLDFEEKGGGLR